MSNRVSLALLVSFLLGAAASSAVGATPPDSAGVPSIETFMQIGSADRPQASLDGGTVFFRSSMAGVDQVYTILPSGWPYQLTAFVDGIDYYRVSRSGTRLVVGASVGGSEQSNLYILDTQTGVMSALKRAERVQHGSPVWSGDERYVYFRSNEEVSKDFYVYRADVATGTVEAIWKREGWNEPVGVSRDGRSLLASHAESNVNNDLHLIDLASGSETLLTRHGGDYQFEYATLSPDLRYIYFVTNMNQDGMARVARKPLAGGPVEFINDDSPWETEEMALSDDGKTLAWVENVDGYGALYVLNLERGKKTEVSRLRGIVSGVKFAGNASVVFAFSSASLPGDVWRYDISTEALTQLTFSTYAGIDKTLFVEPALVRYETFDGLGIPAFLYLPRNWDGSPIPFIIDVHGGPEDQFRPSFVRHFQYLLLNGYGILAPNIRGSSGYGRDYIKLDDYRKRKDAIRDLYHAAEYLADKGYSRFGMIGIKGGSYGGYATLAALTEYPQVFGAGLDDVGIANFVTFLKNTADYRREIREAEYGPLTDEAFLLEISPITNADRIRAPLLIVHGENDPRVPVGEARQIADAIRTRGGVVETLIFPDEGHGVAKLSNRLVYYLKMVEFFDKYLKR